MEKPNLRPRVEVCPACDEVNRREFLKKAGGTLVAGAAAASIPLGIAPVGALAAATRTPAAAKPSETFVKLLYETLTADQRKIMHFPFDHPLRLKIANNWNIVDPDFGSIGTLYTPDQQELIRQIFRGLVTEEGYERFEKQMRDDSGGFDKYTCALFGKPGEEKFEWVMTGRHLTVRADGNSVNDTAFGGPIFYGHATKFNEAPDHPGNVWWHQGKLANQVFESLDGKQREKALLDKAPPDNEDTIVLKGKGADIPGLAGAELSDDQKEHLKTVMKSLLAMFRQSDVDEAVECIEANGGFDALNISFYKEGDLGKDDIWDRWRVEGPAFVWYFRGSPHVHTWVNIAHRAPADAASA